MKLSIVVPVYNEEDIIKNTLEVLVSVLSKLPLNIEWDIVVADNGSTDSTTSIVDSLCDGQIKILTIKEKGKGVGIRSVAAVADVDFFGFIDADLSADPRYVASMLEILTKGDADVVIGSRLVDESMVHRGKFRTITSKIFNLFQRVILGLDIRDTQCGLKIMNKKGLEVFRLCKEKTWFFDVEFLYLAKKKNLRVVELPVAWEEFLYKDRKTKLNLFRDGLSAFITMIKIRIRQKNK